VRTRHADAEHLTARFPANHFDFVYARNCLDHSYDPERAITQIVEVTKPGCYALLEHLPNEGESEEYGGFHQWNFSSSPAGEFIISAPSKPTVNMTTKYRSVCTITCEESDEPGERTWLITRIRKHPHD
jgi:SAM-dependent methyltransferase